MKTTFQSILLFSILFLSTSCATVFRGSKISSNKTVNIDSYPSNSKAYVDDEYIGETPIDYNVKNRKKHEIKIEKEGYITQYDYIGRKLNPVWTGTSILLGGFFTMGIGPIVDFKNGSVFDIKYDSIFLNLKPIPNNKGIKRDTINYQATNNDYAEAKYSEEVLNDLEPKAILVSTNIRELYFKPKTIVRVKTLSGKVVWKRIKSIDKDFFTLKNGDAIYYNDIKLIRGFSPFFINFLPIGPGTAWWFATSKVAKLNSKKQKHNILSIKAVNKKDEFEFGKAIIVK